MKLLITKDKYYLKLPDEAEMYQDSNNNWWWRKIYRIDAIKVSNPNMDDYKEVYEDGKDFIEK